MHYFENADIIDKIYIYQIGNKYIDEPLVSCNEGIIPEQSIKQDLMNLFIRQFTRPEYYQFSHDTLLDLNEAYVYLRDLLECHSSCKEQSDYLAQLLYRKSSHPQIKSGEFYVVCFNNVILNGETLSAVGLFKSESKESLINVVQNGNSFEIEKVNGINKLDKGCLIFNTKKEEGYVVAVVDNTNKSDAKYWVKDFLGVKPRQDKYFQTQNFMSVCKSFVTKQLPSEFEVSKADQAEILNRSVQYFKDNDEFSIQEFSETVLGHPEVIESFQSYKERYQTERDIEIEDSFAISNDAVKKQARSFKSVIKLDKNFHIYVHGNRNLIEQGEDEKGRYYKVYYTEEY